MTNQLDHEELFNEAWSKFNEQITSDEDAADAIFNSLLHDNKVDCGCSYPQIVRAVGDRCYSCLTCKREVWFTANTLFAGVSRLRAWRAAVWFKEWGVTISSLRLSRLLDIAQSTALNINKKVSIALVSQMDESAQEVDSKAFVDVIFRRSRQTPADQHPREEIENSLEVSSDNASRRAPLSIALSDSTHQISISVAIAAAIAYIRKYFHGVSHKYLQIYLGAFWSFVDRDTWSEGAVLRACLKHPPVSYTELLKYRTAEIKMMLT